MQTLMKSLIAFVHSDVKPHTDVSGTLTGIYGAATAEKKKKKARFSVYKTNHYSLSVCVLKLATVIADCWSCFEDSWG